MSFLSVKNQQIINIWLFVFMFITISFACGSDKQGQKVFVAERSLSSEKSSDSNNNDLSNQDITLLAGCEYSYPPFCIVDEDGNADGFSVELLKDTAKIVGINLEFKVDYWDQLKDDLREGNLQILPLVGRTLAREKYFDFTFPYTTNYGAIFVRRGDGRIVSVEDLSDKEVVVMKGDVADEYVTREKVSDNLIRVDTYEAALKLLSDGNYDAVIMQQLMGTDLIEELKIDNVVPVGSLLYGFRQDFCFAVRKGDKKLQSLLNEGLNEVIDNGTYDKLYEKWFSDVIAKERKFVLSYEERQWLQEHPDIKLGFNPYMEPLLVQNDDGSLGGIYPTIIKEINDRFGLDIKIVVDDWEKIVQKARNRELDGLLANAPSQSKASGLLGSKPIHTSYPIIYSRYDSDIKFESMGDLAGKKVAYQGNVKMLEVKLSDYKDKCEIITTNGTLQALKLLLEGKVDLVLAINFENYLVAKNSLAGVKILYYDIEDETPTSIGIRNDWPELVSIINKGLDLIGPVRLHELVARWTDVSIIKPVFELSDKEKKWLADHPDIVFGYDKNAIPISYEDSESNARGIIIDYLDLINKKNGTHFKAKGYIWGQVANKVRDNEIAGLLCLSPSAARQYDYLSTYSHFSSTPTVFAMKNSDFDINRIEDIKGKRVAYLEGSRYVKDLLQPFKGKVGPVPCDSYLDALRAVFEGRADVCICLSTNNYLIKQYDMVGLTPKLMLTDKKINAVIGVRSDYPELISILNKAILSISDDERDLIHDKWSVSREIINIGFNHKEKLWLANHPVIKFGLPENMKPLSFEDENGVALGIFVDYIHLIGERLGVDLDPETFAFDDIPPAIEAGNIDVMPTIESARRASSLIYSDGFIDTKHVIITRIESEFIKDINWLSGKKVAAIEGSAAYKYLLDYSDKLEIVPTANGVVGLKYVADGKCDAYVGIPLMASYIIITENIPNLKIAATAGFPDEIISFGVRNEYSELVPILNKAISSISEEEYNGILSKWMRVRYEQVNDWVNIWKWVGIIAAVPIGGLIIVIFWNYQLGRVVKTKTEELWQAKKFTEDAINSLQDTFLVFDPVRKIPVLWNKSMYMVTGYTDEEVRNNPVVSTYFSESDKAVAEEAVTEAVGKGYAACELNVIRKDGTIIPTDFVFTRVDNKDGTINSIVVVGRDITERKATQQELEKHRQHLEDLVNERTEELNSSNQELTAALSQLKNTQAQLVLFEKLGALKHLVSGIAHELNSPLGAINNSREVLWNNIKRLSENVLKLAHWIEGTNGDIVASILENSFKGKNDVASISPREKRQARQRIEAILDAHGIKDSDQISQKLVSMNIYDGIEQMLPVLQEEDILDNLDIVGSVVESAVACDTIKLAVTKASKIVNALNSYIRKGPEQGGVPVLEKINIKETLDNVLTLFYNSLKYNVELEFDCPDGLQEVLGDSDSINQVWTNIIKNSLDAMTEKGELKIKVSEQDNGILVSVQDNGIGMTEEVKTRVFEPLFTTKPAGEGTGLGMDIVHQIVVQNHGGRIDIDSTLGVGTTITVWLPFNNVQNENKAQEHSVG